MTTILILDDNPTVLRMLALILRASGIYRVLEASTEQEAVAQCEQRNREIDVLVADVCIGDEPGREIADRLTALCPHLRVLFISGYPKDHLIGNGWVEPDDTFLAKPFTPARLMLRVEEVLGPSYVAPAMRAVESRAVRAGGAV